MAFMHQKFLWLWERGIRPDLVVVAYSMNEGWLGHLVDSDEMTKRQFERRVWLKNKVRSVALYNLVVENWARSYYDSIKTLLVPGTHVVATDDATRGPSGDGVSMDADYDRALARFTDDLRARNVAVVFLALAAFDGRAMAFATTGPYQRQFVAFAEARGIPVLRSDEILRRASGSSDLLPFFLDHGHMNADGNRAVGAALAGAIDEVLATGHGDAP
jgi:lysophospholipase L1-like esterase